MLLWIKWLINVEDGMNLRVIGHGLSVLRNFSNKPAILCFELMSEQPCRLPVETCRRLTHPQGDLPLHSRYSNAVFTHTKQETGSECLRKTRGCLHLILAWISSGPIRTAGKSARLPGWQHLRSHLKNDTRARDGVPVLAAWGSKLHQGQF